MADHDEYYTAWLQVQRINRYLYRRYGYEGNEALHMLMKIEMELAEHADYSWFL